MFIKGEEEGVVLQPGFVIFTESTIAIFIFRGFESFIGQVEQISFVGNDRGEIDPLVGEGRGGLNFNFSQEVLAIAHFRTDPEGIAGEGGKAAVGGVAGALIGRF